MSRLAQWLARDYAASRIEGLTIWLMSFGVAVVCIAEAANRGMLG